MTEKKPTSPTTDSMDGKAAVPRRRRLYGRRSARPLRAGEKALLAERLPEMALPPLAEGEMLATVEVLGAPPRALWLEIGFGTGEHLAWQAEHHPDVCFLGAEFFINGIAKLVRRADQAQLQNIHVFQDDARLLLTALPAASLSRVFILFPDPWPKLRHHKRRLIQTETLDRLAVLMQPGAELRIGTDHADYLDWILRRTSAHPAFEWLARRPQDWRQRPADWPETRYEQKALAEGRTAAYLRYRRRPA